MEALVTTVESLLEAHRKLVQLLNRKKDLLIQNDIDGLNRLVKDEESQIRTIHQLEQERLQRGRIVAENNGIPIEDLRLSTLLELTNDQPILQNRLKKVDREFPAVISLLRGINELNGQLLTQSLRYLETTLDVLTDSSSSMITYHGREETAVAKRSFFDSKI